MKIASKQYTYGIWVTALAYIIWGFLPLYWKHLDHVLSFEILAHRILWSLVFVTIFLFLLIKIEHVWSDIKKLFTHPKQLLAMLSASLLISLNWVVYIWAVNSNHIVETSLGYYINPLISVLLGVLVLRERLSFWQTVSFVIAAIGVTILTVSFGKIPWVAFALAFSFAIYGLIKKVTSFNPLMGLAFETLFVTPIALLYVGYLHYQGLGSFGTVSITTTLLLIGAGIVTALPLLLFAKGAKSIPMSMIGFLQYIAPSIGLVLGVFLYKEPFTTTHFITFTLIWTALLIFSVAKTKPMIELDAKLFRKKNVSV